MAAVTVNLVGHRYDIRVEEGILARAGQILRELSRSAKLAVVSDDRVAPLYLPAMESSLRSAGFDVVPVIIPSGEEHKTLATIQKIYDTVLPAKIDRATPLVALGGGVVGDMTGFAAATILRGVPFVQVPTTLLSMVDASVGGKTGIDHPVGKNLIGAFHQPIAVLVDPRVLASLPVRELRGGLAECIKHEIIRDAAGFDDLEKNIGRALKLQMDYMTGLVAHNVAIKARVVEADPFEQGERAHLNLGHTFAHAIETVSNYAFSHGEAVALGMAAAADLAVRLKMLDEQSRARMVKLIAAAGLPVSGMKLDPHQVAQRLIFDKKVRGGKVRFVLPDRIGRVVIRDDVSAEVVSAAVQSIQ